jgi:murein DD-endopeptidase MepM/ murein hydrolase activator NlpD
MQANRTPSGAAGAPAARALRESRGFGKRDECASIAFTRNGRTTFLNISPMMLGMMFSVFALFMTGYMAATAYLVLRDDLVGAVQARNARMLHEYEDRIAALRTNLDKVTSRQMLDQQAVEAKVAELLERQNMLADRSGSVGQWLEKARGLNLEVDGGDKQAQDGADPLKTGAVEKPQEHSALEAGDLASAFSLRGSTANPTRQPSLIAQQRESETLKRVRGGMQQIETAQIRLMDAIRAAAIERSARLAGIYDKLALPLPAKVPDAVGGPFVPADGSISFQEQEEALQEAVATLEALKGRLKQVPVANPAPGKEVTSSFGSRLDPFLGRAAMHLGIDFRIATGEPVYATASGTVREAGRNGGYGNMVEIEHAHGLSTRYAHLSKLLVEPGQKVAIGQKIGLAGSTGRSTGPHLHYEVRRNGEALNPARFLKAGREARTLMDG